MFVSFQIILESRISDKWYTFRSESIILEYFKFCESFLKPSPPKMSSSTHLSCFTNYKLLHKERLLDVHNPRSLRRTPTRLRIQWPPSKAGVLQCPLFSSLPPGPESTDAIWDHSFNHGAVRSEAMSESSPYWRRKAALYSTLKGGKRGWDKIRLSLLTWVSDDLRIISKQN